MKWKVQCTALQRSVSRPTAIQTFKVQTHSYKQHLKMNHNNTLFAYTLSLIVMSCDYSSHHGYAVFIKLVLPKCKTIIVAGGWSHQLASVLTRLFRDFPFVYFESWSCYKNQNSLTCDFLVIICRIYVFSTTCL